MNKVKALITSLVLASSSAAFADVGPLARDHRAPAPPPRAPIATAHARIAPIARPPHRPVWMPLGMSSAARRARTTFAVGVQKGAFTKLELVSKSGTTLIKQVTITFANGQQQVVNLNRYLSSRRDATLSIDLAGSARYITSVTVKATSSFHSKFELLALRSTR